MADDACILEQTIEVALGEARYPVEVKIMEDCPEVLALSEDGAPTQPRLKPLQAKFLKQAIIVADWEAPFSIVIAEKFWRGNAPAASRFAIRT